MIWLVLATFLATLAIRGEDNRQIALWGVLVFWLTAFAVVALTSLI